MAAPGGHDPETAIPGEALIRTVVDGFYAKVRADAELGPIFGRAIADWPPHLEKMYAFWSSVMRMSGRYTGNPMAAHLRLKAVRPEHFARWLALFRETVRETCPPAIAAGFEAKAEMIARSLQLAMFYRPDAPAAEAARAR